jgi:predicted small secreted protein
MKTFKFLLLALLFATLITSSCETTSYIGETLKPTANVDVYYAAKDIKREYKVIGHLSVAVATANENGAKAKLIEKAKAVGAEGIIIIGLDFTGGKDSQPFEKADAIKYAN